MKYQINQLGLFGAAPLFSQPLVVGQPDTLSQSRIMERIEHVIASGFLTNDGPLVKQFEAKVCDITGAAHCVAVCNGTMALQIMAKACGLSGEVIVPAFTFIATAHALEWIGIRPVFADIDPQTHTLNVDSVRLCISRRTSAILGVHLWGNPCDIESLQQLADEHQLQLLFDACHAFGCRRNGRAIGTFGVAEAFSFHATKFVHSLEGGAIVTPSAVLADRMRLLRNFGITGLSTVESAGINGKLNDVCAAVGLTSLESMTERMQHNRCLQAVYRDQLADCPGLRVLPITADNGGNGQYVVLLVDSSRFGMHRNELLQVLRADGVFGRSYFAPGCHRSMPYVTSQDHHPVSLQTTELILDRVLQLPVGPAITVESARTVCSLLTWVSKNARAIQERIHAGWPVSSHTLDPAAIASPLPLAG
ncbi:MAG: DegT/DnrJ/EryC1/StrS family aminotransferase [Planctomycetaceae bacterium]